MPRGLESPPAMPESLKAVSRGRSGPLPPTTRAACLSAPALCYAHVGKTFAAHPDPHNVYYDVLCVTFRGWRGCGRSTVVLVVLRLPRHPRNVTQSKYVVFIIIRDIICVRVAANVLFLRAPVLGTLCACTPFVPFSVPCWGEPQTPKAV